MRLSWLLLTISVLASTANGQIKPLPEKLINYDPSGLIRFKDLKSAESRRTKLIQYVWRNGLPKKTQPTARLMPKNVFGKQLSGIDPRHAKQVLELECEMKPYDFVAFCYLIESKVKSSNNRRLVVVHSGHRQGLEIGEGVDRTIEEALKRGFQVLVVDMPLVGWNTDKTLTIPATGVESAREIEIGNRGTSSHNDMFRQLGDPTLPEGTVFRFFVEPVVQGINYFEANTENSIDVAMVGLSGGGWATHFCAAIDSRIRFSFPVAGAMPLYARKFSRGSWGDAEQNYDPVYRESDEDGDGIGDTAKGVASWLEIFALGGIGKTRSQVQILNLDDPCCFSTVVYETYDSFLKKKVKSIGQGSWDLFSDRTHKKHIISAKAIELVFEMID